MVQEKPFDHQRSEDKDILGGAEASASSNLIDSAAERSSSETADDTPKAPIPDAVPSTNRTEPGPTAPMRSASTPAMIGAGIFGGLIALATAGSMQYAGYLPAATPETAVSASASNSDTERLRAEIDGLKQQLATIPADIAPSGDLEKRIAALESRPETGGGDPQADARLQALEERLNALQQAATRTDSAASQTIADLTARLDKAEKTLAQRPGEAAVSRTIAATYLKAAVDRGAPFLTELETFAALAPDDPALEALRPLAANGIASRADIASRFEDVATAVVNAVNEPVAGEGWTDRLLSSARSLISIRPVGNVEGSDAGAILARMEERLKNGDLKGASLEWDALPEAGRKASQDFKSVLDNRIKADELTAALVDRARASALQAG